MNATMTDANGFTRIHPQVDTGLGFTCDELIVETVKLLNAFPGVRTTDSCQLSPDEMAIFSLRMERHPDFVRFYETIASGGFTNWYLSVHALCSVPDGTAMRLITATLYCEPKLIPQLNASLRQTAL